MSTTRYTYKGQARGVALMDSEKFKAGEPIPLKVYELYMDSRGNPQGTTETVYFLGTAPNPEAKPSFLRPKGLKLNEGKDFRLVESKEDVMEDVMPSKPEKELLSNNKTVMWLGLIVVGYFAYRYYNKK